MNVIPTDEERDPLDELAEEFLERFRRGERPAVAEFAARAPDRAGELRELLSALLMVEDIRPQANETIGGGHFLGPGGVEPGVERLGDYRLIGELGRGGMGVVYEAEQISLGRRVALKVLSPGIGRSSRQVQRFLREARSAAQLHHTNIVPVFGVGDQDGLYFYAMQFISGQGLDKVLDEVKRHRDRSPTRPVTAQPPTHDAVSNDDTSDVLVTSVTRLLTSGELARPDPSSKLRRAKSPPPEPPQPSPDSSAALPGGTSIASATDSRDRYAKSVARIGVQVADALEYAHRHGTLHRDIKPSNLLLDSQGTVWVTDFGLAKAAEDEDLTKTGDFVGTLRYMAPERFKGRCDRRSDIHALGLTLYELLAMRPAFDAPDRDQLVYQITHREPARLGTLVKSLPRDLETIVHKAIEMNPGDRYATAGAMAEDLRSYLEDRPIEARRVGSTERLTRWAMRNPGLASLGSAVACLLAVMVVVITVADLYLRREHNQAMNNLRRAVDAEARVVTKYLDSSLAQARAGRRSGMAGRRFDGLKALRDATRLDVRGDRAFEFRNEAIACLALADLRPAVRWTPAKEGVRYGLDFDANLTRVARGIAGGDILVQDISGKQTLMQLTESGLDAILLRFSPDGRFLAAKLQGESRTEFVVYDLNRAEAVLRVPDGVYADAFDFLPDGSGVAAGRRDGTIVIYDPATGREKSRLAPVTVPHVIRFDPTGRRIAIASPNSDDAIQIRRVEDGKVEARWTKPEGAISIDWHPTGHLLAAGGTDGRIFLLEPGEPDRTPRVMERHGGTVVELAFHPAGELLASAGWDGLLRLWDIRSGREVVKNPLHETRRLRFSRDGRFLGPGHEGAVSYLWEVAEGREYRPIVEPISPTQIQSVETLSSAGLTVVAFQPGLIVSADGAAAVTAAMPGTTGAVISPDGSAVFSAGSSGLLRWPAAKSSSGALRIGPPAPVGPRAGVPTQRIRLSGDGRTLATVMDNESGRVLVLDLKGERPPVELAGHARVERLDISPDGRLIATGTWKGTGVKVWNARTGALVADLPVTGSADVVFNPDGRWLVTGSGKEYVLWNVANWAVHRRIAREQAGGLPGEAAFRHDGHVLAVARTRTQVLLMDPETGAEFAALESSEPQGITKLSFGANGHLLVVTSGQDDLRVWDLGTVRRGLAELGLDWEGCAELAEAAAAKSPAAPSIVVEPAPWLKPSEEADQLARAGNWRDAATGYRNAIAAGAPGVEQWTRLALACVVLGDREGYREVCRHIIEEFAKDEVGPKTANNIAWACSVGPDARPDYEAVLRMAEAATSGRREQHRLNTLGAAFYRAGRLEDAIEQLGRSVAAHGAGGTIYDAVFMAMAHHRLGHADEAKKWLERAGRPAPVAMRKPDATGSSSWIPRVELDLLRREAASLIEGFSH